MLPSSADIPDLGLPACGLRTWHLGARVFAFDLSPSGERVLWVDEDRISRFPTGSERDHAERVAEARAEWQALKKQIPTALAQARALLQAALDADAGWTIAGFQQEVIAHPVLRRLGSRMVWAVLDAQGRPLAYGRLTRRGRWDLGVGRGPELPDGAAIIALPRADRLPPDILRAWQARFPDQPVAQLHPPG